MRLGGMTEGQGKGFGGKGSSCARRHCLSKSPGDERAGSCWQLSCLGGRGRCRLNSPLLTVPRSVKLFECFRGDDDLHL